jgi:hypothetical protein
VVTFTDVPTFALKVALLILKVVAAPALELGTRAQFVTRLTARAATPNDVRFRRNRVATTAVTTATVGRMNVMSFSLLSDGDDDVDFTLRLTSCTLLVRRVNEGSITLKRKVARISSTGKRIIGEYARRFIVSLLRG